MIFAPSKSRWRAEIWIMGVSKTSDQIQIMIKMPNPSQEPSASSKAQNPDFTDMNVLCTFKIKICRWPKFGTWVYQRPMTKFNQDQDA